MTPWRCGRCSARVAPGAPRCPECPSTEFIKPEAEAAEVLKIARNGTVTDSADVRAAEAEEAAELAGIEGALAAEEAREHPGTGEEMRGTEALADGTEVSVSNPGQPGGPVAEQVVQLPPGETAVPHRPVAPPRRMPPKASGD